MGVTTVVVATGGALATAAAAWSVLWWYEGERCEKPKYSVKTVIAGRPKYSIRDFNVMEVREYEPYVVAQATVTGAMRKSMSVGFMKVARYIFGDNTKKGSEGDEKEKVSMTSPVMMEVPSENIAMTSPVQMQEQDASGGTSADGTSPQSTYKISFVMPSSYTLGSLPVPKDTELELKEVPGHTLAAYTFFGASPSEKRVAEAAAKLKAAVEAEGIKVAGAAMLYQYHPPFAPAFLRRVEVLYAVH